MTILDLRGVDVRYGDFQALFGIDLAVEAGETVAVLGANGAGKSTLLKTVAGLLRPSRGEVRMDGRDVTGLPAHRRARLGVALVPEGRRLFGTLTIEENLRVGGWRARPGPWDLAAVYELFPLLAERRDRLAARLSGGEQQAAAIGRGLLGNPRLLLLDEVSLGLAPVLVHQLYATLPRITATGTTVLLVEQDVRQATAVADRVHCLLAGRTSLTGLPADLSAEQVARAYFGM